MALAEYLKTIADAIRAKKGTTELINAQDFATEILTLSSGDGSGESNLIEVGALPASSIDPNKIYLVDGMTEAEVYIVNNGFFFTLADAIAMQMGTFPTSIPTVYYYLVDSLPDDPILTDLQTFNPVHCYIHNDIPYVYGTTENGDTWMPVSVVFSATSGDTVENAGRTHNIRVEQGISADVISIYVYYNNHKLGTGQNYDTYSWDGTEWTSENPVIAVSELPTSNVDENGIYLVNKIINPQIYVYTGSTLYTLENLIGLITNATADIHYYIIEQFPVNPVTTDLSALNPMHCYIYGNMVYLYGNLGSGDTWVSASELFEIPFGGRTYVPETITQSGIYVYYIERQIGLPNNCHMLKWNGAEWGGNNAFSFTYNIELVGEIPPFTYSNLPVTHITMNSSPVSIGDRAFSDCSNLTTVEIGSSVTSIDQWAFWGCSKLTSVVMPESITFIGQDAFRHCDLLEYEVEDDLKYLGNENNPYLCLMTTASIDITSLNINDNCKVIASYAFEECNSLISVIIPDSITSIGSSVFNNCDNLISIYIPNSVTYIAPNMLFGFHSLITIYCEAEARPTGWDASWVDEIQPIVWGVKEFGSTEIFEYCITQDKKAYLTTYKGDEKQVIISETINEATVVDFNRIFRSNTIITSVEIPNTITSISDDALEGCSSLTSVVIPNSVTSIGSSAFSGCSSLTSVVIPNSVTYIGGYAFSDCSGLTSVEIPDSVTSIDWGVFYRCSSLTSVEIPASVTSIGSDAFYYCRSLTSIEIPNSVISIRERAFALCESLTNITFNGTIEQWNSITKATDWNRGVPATVVVCTDGEVAL